VPEQYQAAETVYLSQNNLRSLQGIQQFPHLRVLSAADNMLKDMSALSALAAVGSSLKVASFERNPVTHLPNYRLKVLQLLPELEVLDGVSVQPQDRQKVKVALQHEAACMAVMLSNACMVHKLVGLKMD
jgi:hypothetical protein